MFRSPSSKAGRKTSMHEVSAASAICLLRVRFECPNDREVRRFLTPRDGDEVKVEEVMPPSKEREPPPCRRLTPMSFDAYHRDGQLREECLEVWRRDCEACGGESSQPEFFSDRQRLQSIDRIFVSFFRYYWSYCTDLFSVTRGCARLSDRYKSRTCGQLVLVSCADEVSSGRMYCAHSPVCAGTRG